jgi:hypothetical protein
VADNEKPSPRMLIAQFRERIIWPIKIFRTIIDAGDAGDIREDQQIQENRRRQEEENKPQTQTNERPFKPEINLPIPPVYKSLPERPVIEPIPIPPYQPPINRPEPEPTPPTTPAVDPNFAEERRRAQREYEAIQREAAERQRRNDEANEKDDAIRRANDEKLRKFEDARSKLINDALRENQREKDDQERENRRSREVDRVFPTPDNTFKSPFGGPTSYILQTGQPSDENDFGKKLTRAILLSLETGVLKEEVLKSMQKLLTPETLAAMGGFIAIVGSGNLAAATIAPPIGLAIAAVVDAAMAVVIVGGNAAALWEGSTALASFLTKTNSAKTDAEFLEAAKDFAKFANVVGPDIVLNMTGAKAGKALGNIGGKLAAAVGELGKLLPEKQKQIGNGLRAGSNLLSKVGQKVTDGFSSIFKHIDDALKHLTGEKKAANNLAAAGEPPSGNGKKPDKPNSVQVETKFPEGSPIKVKPEPNQVLKTSTDVQNWIILNIDKRLIEKQAALKELAEARALGKSKKEIEKINAKIGQADDALVNAGATWKLAEEGIDVTEFESKINRAAPSSKNTGGAVAEADIGGKKWWVETGNGGGGKLDQIIKALSNPEANPNRRSLIAYIPKFPDSAAKQITDAGGYVAKDYNELSRLVKQAEKGELAPLNSASVLGRQFKAVLKNNGDPAILPFDFNTLDHAFKNAVELKENSGVKYGYIITKQDSKILIPGKSKATVLPIPGRDNQGVIVKFTLHRGQYKVELMTGLAAPAGLGDKLTRELNLNEIFKREIPKQTNIPKGIHEYEGVIDKRNKGTISEELNKEVYTAQAQPTNLVQPSVAEQLRAKMNAQKLSLGWVDNKPIYKTTTPSIEDSIEKIKMLNSSLDRQNRFRQALINQGKELDLHEAQAQIVANAAAEISATNSKPRPRQNQREM